jgi:hypothetical protein
VLEDLGVEPPGLDVLEALYQRHLDVLRPDGPRNVILADLWLAESVEGAVQPVLPGMR